MAVYAIGDVTGEPMLAHRAMAQGAMTAEIIAGHNRAWDRQCIPAICFTDPAVVTAGLSPDEARAEGRTIKIGMFPFQANGRAISTDRDDGFVRVVARADNHLVLGIQAVGAGVGVVIGSPVCRWTHPPWHRRESLATGSMRVARGGRQVLIDQRSGRFEVPRAIVSGPDLGESVFEDMRISFDFTDFESGGPGTVGYAQFMVDVDREN